tara:strand:+ start:835 stop:1248 length:414 start_codon:yes stop_codon:yes gene_type:complete
MSLPEVLISSILLASSSSAALGVWSQATATWQQSSTLQQTADQLELLQLASHRWLKGQGAERNLVRSGLDPCRLDTSAVAVALDQAVPLPQGITRQWVVDSERLGVWQELSALNADGEVLLQRRQLVSPAAYGLCRS